MLHTHSDVTSNPPFSVCHDRVITNGERGLERSNGSTIECVCLCCYVSICVCLFHLVCVCARTCVSRCVSVYWLLINDCLFRELISLSVAAVRDDIIWIPRLTGCHDDTSPTYPFTRWPDSVCTCTHAHTGNRRPCGNYSQRLWQLQALIHTLL